MIVTAQPSFPVEPAADPPPDVRNRLLWRLAQRVVCDHVREPWEPRCAACYEPWPCVARRLGERGLRAAVRAPRADGDRA